MHNNPNFRTPKPFEKDVLVKALEYKFFDIDFSDKEITMRKFFEILLLTLWYEKDSFSGKRPFGNSGWEYQVYKSLIRGGFISGSLDEDGFVEHIDISEADRLVAAMIKEAFVR